MRRHSSFIFIGVLAAAALAAGCASHPEIRTDKDPTANIAAPKTFGFFNPLATDKARYSTLVTARLKAATRTQLEKHGYVYSEDAPDLKVNFFVNVQDRQDVRATAPPAGRGFYGYRLGYRAWGAYPYDIETVSYKQGTLAIDLIDANRNTLVWQGVAQGRLDAKMMKNPAPAIDKVVGEIFANFPGKTEATSLAAAK